MTAYTRAATSAEETPISEIPRPFGPDAAAERGFRLFRDLVSISHTQEALARLLRLAAWSVRGDAAAVFASLPGRVVPLAGFNLPAAPDDPMAHPLANGPGRHHPVPLLDTDLPFSVTLVVQQAADRAADLAATGPAAQAPARRPWASAPWPSPRGRATLAAVAASICEQLSVASDLVQATDGDMRTNPSLARLSADLLRVGHPAALLAADGRCLAFNTPFLAWTGLDRGPIGLSIAELELPGAAAIARRIALAQASAVAGETEFLSFEEDAPGPGSLLVRCIPVGIADHAETLLMLVLADATQEQRAESALEARIKPALPAPSGAEPGPTSGFLLETLVPRTAMRSRKAMSYITVRTWRKAIKPYQLKALRSLKAEPPDAFVAAIAAELEAAVRQMIGLAAFHAVVPIPCGHSGTAECLSVRIARQLAERAGLPMLDAFAHRLAKGSSHPKENARRPPLRLLRPVECPVLVVDDVATSGQHLEEAVKLLRPGAGAVLPVAWIGGETPG